MIEFESSGIDSILCNQFAYLLFGGGDDFSKEFLSYERKKARCRKGICPKSLQVSGHMPLFSY